MSQNVTTTDGKAKDRIIDRIVGLVRRVEDVRVALGVAFRDGRAAGISVASMIELVKAKLDRHPRDYLGYDLTPRTVTALIAMADAIERNPGGFIAPNGTTNVRAEDLQVLKLDTRKHAALVTAIDDGLNGRPGIAVGAVRRAIDTVKKHGLESERGQTALNKLLDRMAHLDRYGDAEEGSVKHAELLVLEQQAKVDKLQESLNKAKKELAERKAALEQAKARESAAIAERAASKAESKPSVRPPRAAAPVQAAAAG